MGMSAVQIIQLITLLWPLIEKLLDAIDDDEKKKTETEKAERIIGKAVIEAMKGVA